MGLILIVQRAGQKYILKFQVNLGTFILIVHRARQKYILKFQEISGTFISIVHRAMQKNPKISSKSRELLLITHRSGQKYFLKFPVNLRAFILIAHRARQKYILKFQVNLGNIYIDHSQGKAKIFPEISRNLLYRSFTGRGQEQGEEDDEEEILDETDRYHWTWFWFVKIYSIDGPKNSKYQK